MIAETPAPDLTKRDGHHAPDSFQRILAAAGELLTQGESLLGSVTPQQYATRVALALDGSIGAHYRHCLDHFVSLLRSASCSFVDFDLRDRDPQIETDPARALELTREIRESLARWTPGELARTVGTRCEIRYAPGSSPVTGSTLGRELVYVIAHAIHHFAIIAIIGRLQGIRLPEDFGMAPSTLAHLRQIRS